MNARFWLMAAAAIAFACVVFPARTAEPAVLISFNGPVEVMKAGTRDWIPAHTNEVLQPGDRVRTGEGARAMMRLSNNCIARVPPNTIYDVESTAEGGAV